VRYGETTSYINFLTILRTRSHQGSNHSGSCRVFRSSSVVRQDGSDNGRVDRDLSR
jgi:hypothetical protein